jgi:hypothetical protein
MADEVICWDGEGKHVPGVEGFEIDGKEYSAEQIAAFVRFGLNCQYSTPDDILRKVMSDECCVMSSDKDSGDSSLITHHSSLVTGSGCRRCGVGLNLTLPPGKEYGWSWVYCRPCAKILGVEPLVYWGSHLNGAEQEFRRVEKEEFGDAGGR